MTGPDAGGLLAMTVCYDALVGHIHANLGCRIRVDDLAAIARLSVRELARVTRGKGYVRKCKKWALSHTNTYWYVTLAGFAPLTDEERRANRRRAVRSRLSAATSVRGRS